MTEDVKACYEARANYFDQYFTVPQDVQGDVNEFINQAAALGEGCANAAEFEEEFVSTGLSDRFTAVISKCTPKAHKMTREDRKKALQTTKDILSENKKDIARDAVESIAGRVSTELRGEAAEQIHLQRLADGTDAEYTARKNMIDDAGRAIGFLAGLFKKK